MAKTPTKSAAKTAANTPAKAAPKTTKAKGAASDTLEQASEEALKTLQSLGIESQLQAELDWCLGSYRHDKNPSGLLEAAGRALVVLNAEKAKKTKGVTVKLIGDLEKVLKLQ